MQGLKLGLKLEICRLINHLQMFYLLQNSKINFREFKFFLGPLKMRKFRHAVNPVIGLLRSLARMGLGAIS